MFLNFTSSIHAKIMHIYMFWTVSGQIVQMMMHHLHDRVCIFCFLSILVKNGAYTQCKTPKPVSKIALSVTDTHTHTHRHTNILKFEGHLHKRPFGQLEKTREAGLPEGPFVFEKKTMQTNSNRWCIIYLSSTQSTLYIFETGFWISPVVYMQK